MCLIVFAIQQTPQFPLIVAANRDEFLARPTSCLQHWKKENFYAGRDEQAGGTWMGASSDGRWAAVTNFRGPALNSQIVKPDFRSRGELVRNYLANAVSAEDYHGQLKSSRHQYRGFNLLIADQLGVRWISNRQSENSISSDLLGPGIYGLSNAQLNTPWPKLELAKRRLKGIIEAGLPLNDSERELALFDILSDTTKPPENKLPDTGVGLETERLLSSMFITSKDYGTRSSTCLLRHEHGTIQMTEKSYPQGTIVPFTIAPTV